MAVKWPKPVTPAIVWPPLDELLLDWVPLAANAAPETAITAAAIRSFFMVDSKTAWTEQAQEAARLQPACVEQSLNTRTAIQSATSVSPIAIRLIA
ncbi:hypothetical protein MYA_4938 [Burkholderia sp. KJ006]|nr:hypothetical protein MYA_4938 [Burkholderia sp. KJ006]